MSRSRRRRAATMLIPLAAAVFAPCAAAAVFAPCAAAAVAAPRPLFRIDDPRIDEASGIGVGVTSPGVVYVENDSGDTSRFFALNARTGRTVATVAVAGAHNTDWEDLAVAPDPAGTPSVWLADIGDNDAVRPEVQVYRVNEPRLEPSARDRMLRTGPADVWRLRYPDGPVNAESFAVAPDGTGYIVTKSEFGTSAVYRIPRAPDPDHVQTVRRVGTIQFLPGRPRGPFGIAGGLAATGASISADGAVLAVRTYADVYVWRLGSGSVAAALRTASARIELPRQVQGEGLAIDGKRMLVDSEGVHEPVWAVPLRIPRAAASPAPSSTAPSSTVPASPVHMRPSASAKQDGTVWPWAVAAVVALAVVAAAAAALRARPPR